MPTNSECFDCNCKMKNNTNKRLINKLLLCNKYNSKFTFITELFLSISLVSSIYIMNDKKHLQYIK